MNKTIIISLAILVILLAFIGGVFYEASRYGINGKSVSFARYLENSINSKMLSVSTSGTVSDITGKKLLIKKDGNSIEVLVNEKTKIYSVSGNSNNLQTVDFSVIKKGDSVSVFMELDNLGSLIAGSIIVSSGK